MVNVNKNTLTKGLTHPYPTSGDGEESELHAGPPHPPLMMVTNDRHVHSIESEMKINGFDFDFDFDVDGLSDPNQRR
jgi:hypothetical protein